MNKARDIVGKKFGHLTVILELPRYNGRRMMRVHCDCGNTIDLLKERFAGGKKVVSSCGCSEKNKRRSGLSETSEYRCYMGMIARCERPQTARYSRYGARGIRVCDAWRQSFQKFLSDVGPRPTMAHSLDRINNDGNYEPGNVRWATRKEQMRNTCDNRLIEVGTLRVTLIEASELVGIHPNTLWGRLNNGWTPEQTLLTPLDQRRSHAR